MSASQETLAFQAETKELLSLMIHSLYTDKDIFLRELISNASDALDRLRFESLTKPALLEEDNQFEIRIEVDNKARTLTISDTGIGMNRDEVVRNIGTIARSGTLELRENMKSAATPSAQSELIGQFGVGFYSAFMVADKVTLLTRRAGDTAATEWESTGDGTYTIREATKLGRGTQICLSLSSPTSEDKSKDYTSRWRLISIIKKHSDFINYPIYIKEHGEEDPETAKTDNAQYNDVDPHGDNVPVNSMKPIWDRSTSEISAADYSEFYKHLTHDWSEPTKVIHFRAEGNFEYKALLFIPQTAAPDLYYVAPKIGLRLFAKRVMVMELCEELLPRYLRFVRGLVDIVDLPLNISRQRLQEDRHIGLIQKKLTRKILETLQETLDKEPDKYLSIWKEFGRAIKEGIGPDYENKDRIIPLLLFQSSHDGEKLTNLTDYAQRMKPGQEHIFYLTGDSRNIVEHSPHLEAVKDKGYEVLYLVDSVDELLLQYLTEFDGKKLKSLGKGKISLASAEEKEETEKTLLEKQDEYKDFMEFLQKDLDSYVKQVRLSERLTNSPSCLVVEEHDYSPSMERKLRRGRTGPYPRRVLELNPQNLVVSRLRERHAKNAQDPLLHDAAGLLFGLALLAEGSELPDPIQFHRSASEMFSRAI